MKLFIIALRDIKADVYGQPNFVPNLGAAVRQFGDECNREAQDNMLYKHPEDFELYEIGTWSDATCQFELHEPRQIAVGSNYRK